MPTPPPPFPPPPVPGAPIDPARLARNWRAITVELDTPPPARLERMLRRLAMPSDMTRVMSATPSLRRSWFVSLAVIVLIGLSLADPAQPRSSAFGLLLLAPLVPVLGVAFSYGIVNDPAHEIHLATPMSGVRLLAIRTLAMLCVAVPTITLLSLLSPVTRPWAAAWLLPALATSAVTLALMTALSPRVAASVAGTAWVAVNLVIRAITDDALGAFLPAAQFVAAVVVVIAAAVIVVRRSAFDRLAPA